MKFLVKNKKSILLPGMHVNGWIPDPYDARDRKYDIRDSPIADVKALDDCDNRRYFRDVSDQFDLPSCTANAGCDALEAAHIKALVDSGKSLSSAKAMVPDLSRMATWYWGRSFMDPDHSGNAAMGCHNRLIMEVFARFGAAPEELWPYDTALLPPRNQPRPIVRPSIQSQREGARFRSAKFYNIPHTKESVLIDGINKALTAGHNVVWGTAIGANLTYYEGGTVSVPLVTVGRHAMVLCGKQGGKYWNRNSWGRDWGISGYCLIDPDYVAWRESASFWVLVPEALRDVP